MNRTRIAASVAFFLLFMGPAYAQEPQDQPKPRPEEPRSEPRREAAPPAHQSRDEAPSRQVENKPSQPEKQESPKAPKEAKPAQEEKGQVSQQGHGRPGGKSAHIPDAKFKASFTRQHSFKVNQVIHETRVVPGQTQFVYSGYTFIVLDPWPGEWLFTDDCYIDYVDDDYFLFDAFHPGIRIALFVVG